MNSSSKLSSILSRYVRSPGLQNHFFANLLFSLLMMMMCDVDAVLVSFLVISNHTPYQRVSFHSHLGGEAAAKPVTPALACVRDADKLDAIGAIGIARTFTFGGAKGRTLWVREPQFFSSLGSFCKKLTIFLPSRQDPSQKPNLGATKEQYMKSKSTTVNHFYEKLLLLKDMMITTAGRRIAENRHAYMQGFLAQFLAEVNAEA